MKSVGKKTEKKESSKINSKMMMDWKQWVLPFTREESWGSHHGPHALFDWIYILCFALNLFFFSSPTSSTEILWEYLYGQYQQTIKSMDNLFDTFLSLYFTSWIYEKDLKLKHGPH